MCADLSRIACTCGVETPKPNGVRSQQSTGRMLQNAQAGKQRRAIRSPLRSSLGRRMLAGAQRSYGASGITIETVTQGGI
jgi:hypothetical protein